MIQVLGTILSFVTSAAFAAPISTNEVSIPEAPAWLKASRVEAVTDKIQQALEWDIRKVQVVWFAQTAAFEGSHGLGPLVVAYSKKPENRIGMGPRVTAANFDQVFGHELVHIILFQKYKDAVPSWLEEGLANYLAKHGKVDYRAIAGHPLPDVRAVGHPFGAGAAAGDPRLTYAISTAAMEMIAAKCPVTDLLQLSVGKKLEAYLSTYCGISDLNADFQQWVKRKAK